MESIAKVDKLNQNEFQDLNDDFAMELTYAFKDMNTDVMYLVDKAEKENWNPDELVEKIEELFNE